MPSKFTRYIPIKKNPRKTEVQLHFPGIFISTKFYSNANNLLLDNREAPMTFAFSFSSDNTISESLYIKFSVYLRTAEITGGNKYSPTFENSPPIITCSGLNTLISHQCDVPVSRQSLPPAQWPAHLHDEQQK